MPGLKKVLSAAHNSSSNYWCSSALWHHHSSVMDNKENTLSSGRLKKVAGGHEGADSGLQKKVLPQPETPTTPLPAQMMPARTSEEVITSGQLMVQRVSSSSNQVVWQKRNVELTKEVRPPFSFYPSIISSPFIFHPSDPWEGENHQRTLFSTTLSSTEYHQFLTNYIFPFPFSPLQFTS